MNGWIIALMVLHGVSLGVVAAKNGEPRAPYSFGASLIASAITWALLYMGGVFE